MSWDDLKEREVGLKMRSKKVHREHRVTWLQLQRCFWEGTDTADQQYNDGAHRNNVGEGGIEL